MIAIFKYQRKVLCMTRDEFIKLLKDNLKPSAQMDFLLVDYKQPITAFLNIHDVCMNVDVDDPKNINRGGVVFTIQKRLIPRDDDEQ